MDSIALKDSDLVYRACSPAFASALGLATPKDIIGKTDIELFDQNLALQSLRVESAIVRSGKVSILPWQDNRNSAGTTTEQVIVRKPVYSAGDKVTGIEMQIIDVPGQEKGTPQTKPKSYASTHAGSSHEHFALDHLTTSGNDVSVVRKPQNIDFKKLVDSMPNSVVIFRGVKLLYVNKAAANTLGYASQTELMRNVLVSEVLRVDQWVKRHAGANLPISRSQAHIAEHFELQGKSKDGQSLVLHATAREIFWLSEKAVLLSFVDDTERALTEQLLIESEQRFKSFAEASADFFWEMDDQLRFTYFSEEVEQALGFSVKNLLGTSSRDFAKISQTDENRESWREQLDRLLHRKAFSDFEFKWTHPDETTHVIRYSGVPVCNEVGDFLGYRGTGRDITSLYRVAEVAEYHASHDSLTGLVNRRKFDEACKQALRTARAGDDVHALCFLDLDNFKIVNDTCGHHAGDELLRQLSSLFQGLVRKSDVLARIGGDEFAILLYNCGVSEALRLTNQLRSEVENFQFLWEDNRFKVGVSIGVVLVDQRWENTNSLFRAADAACYLAKDRGRNRVVVYRDSETQSDARQSEAHWVDQINEAIADDRLKISYQKIEPLKKDGKLYFEVLMRLITPNGDVIEPKAFLPAAERYGLATKLDEKVLDITLNWLRSNPRIIGVLGMCSINLMGQSFADESFTESLIQKIRRSGIPGSRLCFELTETATIANLSSATRFMTRVGQLGCQFSLDKFGSGLSSFAYVKKLPIQYLKIDGLFIKDVLNDPTNQAMVKAITEIGQTLGKKTIATHIENKRVLNEVAKLGTNFAQGYFIGQPKIIH